MLGGPFRAWATHIVELGPIRVGKFPYHLAPAFDRLGQYVSDHLPSNGGAWLLKGRFYAHLISGRFRKCVELRGFGFTEASSSGEALAFWLGRFDLSEAAIVVKRQV